MANILALVTFSIYPAQMGGQKGVALFYQYLARHHHIVFVLPCKNEDAGEENIIEEKLLFPNRSLLLNIFRIRQLVRIIKREKIDVIIAEHSYPARIACLLKKYTGVPFIIHSHNLEWNRFRLMNRWCWKGYRTYER